MPAGTVPPPPSDTAPPIAGDDPSATPGPPHHTEVASFAPDKWYSELALHKVPPTYLLGAFFLSYLILAISWLETDIAWLAFGLALLPWAVIMLFEVEWTYKHFRWLALGFLMALVQAIHYSEHCIEMVQYHIFLDEQAKSTAIFTQINVEWVHFGGDSLLTIGTLLLIWKFPRNPWFYIAGVFQLAHQAEHNFLWFQYNFLGGKPGTPGVLGRHGVVSDHGVFNLGRVDLHWGYNTLYTIPFVLGLIWMCKRSFDESLEEAFPDAPHEELLQASKHLGTFRYSAGETVTAPGDDVSRLYIISEGMAAVTTRDDEGNEVEVARLHRGQYFGEIALLVPGARHTKTVRALTDLRVLAMDEDTFVHLTKASIETELSIEELAHQRMAPGALDGSPVPAAE